MTSTKTHIMLLLLQFLGWRRRKGFPIGVFGTSREPSPPCWDFLVALSVGGFVGLVVRFRVFSFGTDELLERQEDW